MSFTFKFAIDKHDFIYQIFRNMYRYIVYLDLFSNFLFLFYLWLKLYKHRYTFTQVTTITDIN